MKFIGCDGHKRYSVFVAMDEDGQAGRAVTVAHSNREEYRNYLRSLPPGSPIALEAIGNWYWMVEEMERAGHVPLLTHPGKAKLMMGHINKTDKLDARGLALLLRNGTLPTVWIPSGELRDQRDILRTRMVLVAMQTRLKNRLQATFAKYGLAVEGYSDVFGGSARPALLDCVRRLPPQAQLSWQQQFYLLGEIAAQVHVAENRILHEIKVTPPMQLLMSEPGVGRTLAPVLAWEVGDVERFATAAHLASYAGTVPRVHSSGGKTYLGRVRPDVNRYLQWALVEAANVVVRHPASPPRFVDDLYQRVHQRKGHGKAAVAVARHLAEATYWILKTQQPYREPRWGPSSGQRVKSMS